MKVSNFYFYEFFLQMGTRNQFYPDVYLCGQLGEGLSDTQK